MSQFPSVTPERLIKALGKLGCTVIRQRGSHVYLVNYKNMTRTCVTRHPGEMERTHVRTILRQIEISVEELRSVL